MKILKEIKDKEYYKLDGYQSFEMFTRDYKIAKSQAYEYLKIANAIDEGLVQENDIIEKGMQNSLFFLKDKEELLNEIIKEYKECKKYNLKFSIDNFV